MSKRFARRIQILSLARFSLALAALIIAAGRIFAADSKLDDLKAAQAKSEALVERLTKATVGILNTEVAGSQGLAYGSGVVVSEDGLVLTAGHVIGKPNSELLIVFADGRRVKAVALGADRARDAGMCKISEPGKWPHVELGKSADLKPDQWCLALGHPGGVEEGRNPPVRLGRVLLAGKGKNIDDCVCTDATIISGDSGGPLFDLDGKLVGIHSSIGIMVTQNRHVPIDVFHETWKDLVAGKQTGNLPEGMAHGGGPRLPPDVSPEQAEKFQRLLQEHIKAGDPEVLDLAKNGRMRMNGQKMKELLAKWEAQKSPDKPIDFLKFHRMFEDRLIAGDKEVQGLIKDGKLMLTPTQMQQLFAKWDAEAAKQAAKQAAVALGVDPEKFHRLLIERAIEGDADALAQMKGGPGEVPLEKMKELMDKWAKTPKPASDVNQSDLDELLKNTRILPGGVEFGLNPENEERLLPLLTKLGLAPGAAWLRSGKRSPDFLSSLGPVVSGARPSVAAIFSEGKPVALGTVVRKDGYIVTKASEVKDKLFCKVGKRMLPATIVKKNEDADLALLKVDADDLPAVNWADGGAPQAGAWLAMPGTDEKPLGVGIVSIAARPIPKEPIFVLRNSAAMGVQLGAPDAPPKLESVRADSPADKAKLKAGDVIVSINGKEVSKCSEVRNMLGEFKPGDKITVELKRGEEKIKAEIELGSAGQISAPPGDMAAHHLDGLSSKGGTISKRNNNFPLALTHDAVIQATQCGGPVVDLEGRVVALNIARADRTATYAIPAAKAKELINAMLP